MKYIHCLTLSCNYPWHAEPITLCDHLMWHWPLTCIVVCLPRSPQSIFIRQISPTPNSELCGSSFLCNRIGLHCDTCQIGSKMKIWFTQLPLWLPPPPISIHPFLSFFSSIPFFFSLHEINLLLNPSFLRGAVGTCHMKERVMDLETRQQFDNVILIWWNWKITPRGRWWRGTALPCQSVKHTNLIQA